MSSANHPPALLMLHLLGRCNLECAHCYMEGSPRRREELPLELVLRAIGESEALGIGTIVVTGGEPLLYRGVERVLEAAAASGAQTTLCTNGTSLTSRRAAQLREWNMRVNISIDGHPEYHDRFRHLRGAFRASERGAHAAVAAGLPLTIISSISQGNMDAVDFLIDWAARLGADQFLVQPLLTLGRGTELGSECLTFAQLNRLILHLTDLANEPRYRNLRCQVIGARKKFLVAHPCGAFVCNGAGCHRGVSKEIKKLIVREDGTVLPEVPTLSHGYALGNVREGTLAQLVARYFERGYDQFDKLCRAAYAEVLPTWDCVIVPWEQILSERSRNWVPQQQSPDSDSACLTCLPLTYGGPKPVGASVQTKKWAISSAELPPC
jgi:MoaA/NifB/PqqE/SkfB family radical SAM enzyme